MMNERETDVEVGSSVGISDTEERVVESRRASTAIEESAHEKNNSRCAVEKGVAWKVFKSVVFVICLVFLLIQSVEFLGVYYKYPTTIQLETTLAKDFKLPAITFCFRNTISSKEFCLHEPDCCERPRNMEEFCRKHPTYCQGDTSNLTIPMLNDTTRRIVLPYLFNDSFNDALLFRKYDYTSRARTFVLDTEYNIGRFLKCYSENLHLYQSGSQPATWKFNHRNAYKNVFSRFEINHQHIELSYPIDDPKVFAGFHSPYLPIDSMELLPIRPGRKYRIGVQLEKEEHLLPPPYQTNCRDNGPSEDAKESTNPNSFQLCLELCSSEYFKPYDGCAWGMTMVSSPSDLCYVYGKGPDFFYEELEEMDKKHLICMQHCKQGCLKLQYKYRIKEYNLLNFWPGGKDTSKISFYLKTPEVTVLRHVPLYGPSEIFSYVGGLLGCWLGVSVFTLTDILEKFFRMVVRWKKRFRKRKEKRAPTSEIHQD